MRILSTLILLLSAIFVVGAFWGLINPKRFAQKGQPGLSRGRLFSVFFIFAILSFIVGTNLMPNGEKPTEPTKAIATNIEKPWPRAEITVPQSEIEKKWINRTLTKEPDNPTGDYCHACEQDKVFLSYIKKTYPDVFRVKFQPRADIASDKDTYEMYRTSFYASLYFAKQIKLADGETVFDFLLNCSSEVNPLNSAEIGMDNDGKKFIYIQYFPMLNSMLLGRKDDMAFNFGRYGDIVKAYTSFANNALTSQDFLNKHGLACDK
jgi:hypothetical protein